MTTTRRDLIAGVIAVLSSGAALVLALIANGPYDPTLAVLTATLVGIIWYTFFTFQAVHRVAPVWVELDLVRRASGGGHDLLAVVRNPTEYLLKVSVTQRVWGERALLSVIPIHGGSAGEFFELPPMDTFEVTVKTMQEYEYDVGGTASAKYEDLVLELSAEWKDSFGRSGTSARKYWTPLPVPTRIVSPARLRDLRSEGAAAG
jgi:hypothetical protein